MNADKLTDITSRVANAESTITNFQSTKANKSEVASIAQQNLQSIWRTDAQSAVDALKIGGANLLVDSEYLTTARWGGSSRVASSQYGDRRLTQVFVTQAGTGHFGVTQGTQKATTRIRQGETYTLSLNAQGTAGFTRTGLNYVYLIREDGGNFRLPTLPLTASLSQRPKVTFTAPWTSNQVRLLIGANGIFEATDWFAFHSVKLEMGNVATGWTPTAKDIDDKVSAVQSNLTAYQAAQAKADQAKATQISGLTTRMGAAESNLTRTERAVTELNQTTVTTLRDLTARTKTTEGSLSRLETAKANKTEVASIAQSSLQSIWKADAKSAVDSLSIGARNLLIDSTYNQHINYNTKMSSITRTVYRGNMLIRLGMLGGAGVAGIVQAPAAQVSNIRQGQEYTLSLNVQGTAGIQKTGLNYVFLMRADGANQRLATIPVIASLANRPKITFTAEWTSERAYLLVGVNGTYENTDWLAFHSVKLEKGNVATDWTPAPEDVESSVSAVSAKIDTIQETLANADSALSSRIDTVTASVGSNLAKITQVSNAVAGVDGKLSSTHTIKTETIAGGRKAIAGIALGAAADNRNAESSVIVMADKFEVVKNAQDGQPVRLFGVAQNKVAINGDLIATGTIKGSHIDADSVRAGILTAGAIRTEHLAAGQISADKLAIGLGGNLLVNPIFATPDLSIAPFGWNYWRGEVGDRLNIDTRTIFNRNEQDNYGLKKGGLPNELVFSMRYSTTKETSDTGRIGWLSQDINVVPNKKYIASVWLACHRGQAKLVIENIEKPGGAYLGRIGNSEVITGYSAHQGEFKNMKRVKVVFTAPTSGCIRFALRLDNIQGKANPFLFARRPMLEEASDNVTDITQPSPWQNAGVTAIHGGSIVTNTVTAQQIAANTITANEIAAGTIAARNMAANSINASHIVGSSITADKLNVNNLAAISANLGKVTAGTITGTTITGNTISGGSINGTTISGTTISGGTIKGARLEGATGKFTGELEVSQLIGGGVIEQVTGKLKYSHRNRIYEGQEYGENSSSPIYRHEYIYKATVTINAAPTRRYIEIIGSESFILEANQSITKTIEKSLNRNASGSSLDFIVLAYSISTAKYISIS